MFGITKDGRNWLTPTFGLKFFYWTDRPNYPFRSEDGAKALACAFAAGENGVKWEDLERSGWQAKQS